MYSFLSGFFFSFSMIESCSCCSVYQHWSLFLIAEPTLWICHSYFIPSPLDGYLVVLSLDCHKVAIMYKCLYGHVLSFLLDKFFK